MKKTILVICILGFIFLLAGCTEEPNTFLSGYTLKEVTKLKGSGRLYTFEIVKGQDTKIISFYNEHPNEFVREGDVYDFVVKGDVVVTFSKTSKDNLHWKVLEIEQGNPDQITVEKDGAGILITKTNDTYYRTMLGKEICAIIRKQENGPSILEGAALSTNLQ